MVENASNWLRCRTFNSTCRKTADCVGRDGWSKLFLLVLVRELLQGGTKDARRFDICSTIQKTFSHSCVIFSLQRCSWQARFFGARQRRIDPCKKCTSVRAILVARKSRISSLTFRNITEEGVALRETRVVGRPRSQKVTFGNSC